VGAVGDPDPGVHFVVIVDNPSVRVLQVTLQPGACGANTSTTMSPSTCSCPSPAVWS
jgi:hypothetical protein